MAWPGKAALLAGRPWNALLAALGALLGAAAAHPWRDWSSAVPWVAAAAFFGVLGGNLVNGVRDRELDKGAHPHRPLPSGRVGVVHAWVEGSVLLVLAVLCGAVAGLGSMVVALVLGLSTLGYEFWSKGRWVWGHMHVALNTGGLFVLGALAAGSPGWVVPSWKEAYWPMVGMAVLAVGVSFARELFKSAQDAGHDRGFRATLAVTKGAEVARSWGRWVAWVMVPVALSASLLGVFGPYYLALAAPAVVLLLAVAFVGNARSQQGVLKAAMWAGLLPFVWPALI